MWQQAIDNHKSYWQRLLSKPVDSSDILQVQCLKQGWGELQFDRTVSLGNGPLTLNGKTYAKGFGTHTDSEIKIIASKPMRRIKLLAGVNDSDFTRKNHVDDIIFRIEANNNVLAQSGNMQVSDEPFSCDLELPEEVCEISLIAFSASGNIAYGHANWCNVEIFNNDGNPMITSSSLEPMTYVPFTFYLDGISSKSFLYKWERQEKEEEFDRFSRRTIIFTEPKDKFECSFVLDTWKDYPVSYYKVSFANRGSADSPVLSDVKVLDDIFAANTYTCAEGGIYVPHPGDTSECWRDNFHLKTFNDKQSFITLSGRSSKEWMPFIRLDGPEGGSIISIGWTGVWQMDTTMLGNEFVSLKAGMADLQTYLRPGEEISQPGIMRIDYSGKDPIAGHNILRRFLLNEWIPENMRCAPVMTSSWGGMPAKYHLEHIELMHRNNLPLECYWIDAGWFGHGSEPNQDEFATYWANNVGCWEVNEHVFPNGLKEVADAVHNAGMKLLLWLEPERAVAGTAITEQHPEYFCNYRNSNHMWLNLANPDARQWMLDTLCGIIDSCGVDHYRQDSNDDPRQFWLSCDEPGRKGMTQIRAVEGLYWVLDELRKRYPDMLIDNCASGGCRLDVEMMRRSIPLWPSDMQSSPNYDSESLQELSAGLNLWLPVFAWGTQLRPGDTYNFRSNLASGMNNHIAMYEYITLDDNYPWAWQQKMMAEHIRARPLLSGDYYPLYGQSYNRRQWMILEFYRPDMGKGLVNIMRRSQSCYSAAEINLQGLDADAIYILEDADTGLVGEFTGKELAETGFPVSMPEKRTAKLVFFSRK